MDGNITFAAIYSVLMLLIAGGFLYMSRTTGLFGSMGISSVGRIVPTLTTFQRWGRVVGILIPFLLMAFGPLADLYYNNFRYTTITLVGLCAMILGLGYQTLIRGTSTYLSSLTIGTSSIISYVLYDVWIQGRSYNYKSLSTLFGAVLMFLQLLHTVSGPVFSTSMLNDLIGTMMGSGLGLLAWTIVWNHHRNCLPHSVAVVTK
jgi:hypothetical protein